MNKRKIQSVIRKWQKILELDDYNIYWNMFDAKDVDELQDGSVACVNISQSEKKIHISLSKQRRKEWSEDLIVHELTHALLIRLNDFMLNVLNTYVSDEKARSLIVLHRDDMENEIIDWLVRIFIYFDNKGKAAVTRNKKRRLKRRK